jgi:integrase
MVTLKQEVDRNRQGWRLRYYVDGQRYSMWLGRVSEKMAGNAKRHVEELAEAHTLGCRADASAIKWAIAVAPRLQRTLRKSGLLDEQTIREIETQSLLLFQFLRDAVDQKRDVSRNWKVNYNQAINWLERWPSMNAEKRLADLNSRDCLDWYAWMQKQLAPSTVGQHVKRIKQLLASAVQNRLIPINPMNSVRPSHSHDKTKNRYVAPEALWTLLDKVPCRQWRAILVLTRIAGLRCPSEVLALRWADIDWERGRFTVTSSKGARHSKGTRVVPLFPSVRLELEGLRHESSKGGKGSATDFVITRFRRRDQNLRTQLAKFFQRAGMEEIPKVFNNFRASARADLLRQGYTKEILNDWLGHGSAVAERHYSRITEDDINKAAASGGAIRSSDGGPAGGPVLLGMDRNEYEKNQGIVGFPGSRLLLEYTQMASNH